MLVLLSYFIGSLPIGSYLINWRTGLKAREVSAHNLGVENFLHAIGIPLAVTLLVIDALKGLLVFVIFAANPWTALGVYFGHLYPLNLLTRGNAPRGHGNGVLLGLLMGLIILGHLHLTAIFLPLFLYILLLTITRYTTLATLISLLSVFILLTALQGLTPIAIAFGVIFLLALWRHKASIMRIIEGLEPKLGDPLPIYNNKIIYTAFMVHAMTKEDWWQSKSVSWLKPLLQNLPDRLLKLLVLFMRPNKYGEITGVRLSDGRELRVMLIGTPHLPQYIRNHPRIATKVAIQSAHLAKELGAEALGLGAFWSTVGNKGQEVQEAVPNIHITNGGAYTAATIKAAVPMLLTRYKLQGKSLKKATAAIVGANGVVAFGVARLIVAEVGKLILVGPDAVRLRRSAQTLQRKCPDTAIETSTDVCACARADLIFSATSDPKPVIFANNIKKGAWVFDLGRPADVHEDVKALPDVEVIPGGMVKPPGEIKQSLDLHFGNGIIPACLAETMIMAATKNFERKSLGIQTKTENIDFYLCQGKRLGFNIVTEMKSSITKLVAA